MEFMTVNRHHDAIDQATGSIERAVTFACSNASGFDVEFQTALGAQVLSYRWVLTHARHDERVNITLQQEHTMDGAPIRKLFIDGPSGSASILINDPHHMVAGAIVTAALRGFSLQGVI